MSKARETTRAAPKTRTYLIKLTRKKGIRYRLKMGDERRLGKRQLEHTGVRLSSSSTTPAQTEGPERASTARRISWGKIDAFVR